MTLSRSIIGHTYEPLAPYAVTAGKITEFADAIGEQNPIYREVGAAVAAGHPGQIAPPTFPVILNLRAIEAVVRSPEFGAGSPVLVHVDQSFIHHRPARSGDELVLTTTIDDVTSRAGHDVVTVRGEIATTTGEPVTTCRSRLIVRGGTE